MALLDVLRTREAPVTARELAGKFGLSGRTLYRDLAALKGQGAAMYQALGFSLRAARSYAGMAARVVDGVDLPKDPERGTTTIEAYLRAVLA